MKYDIAKNEDGPLRRTMKASAMHGTDPAQPTAPVKDSSHYNRSAPSAEDFPSVERYPALDERLKNVEKHFAVRYGGYSVSPGCLCQATEKAVTPYLVPSPPRSLLDRLKYLEDHIIHLEKEYPPWAALHFNQPNRGVRPISTVHHCRLYVSICSGRHPHEQRRLSFRLTLLP